MRYLITYIKVKLDGDTIVASEVEFAAIAETQAQAEREARAVVNRTFGSARSSILPRILPFEGNDLVDAMYDAQEIADGITARMNQSHAMHTENRQQDRRRNQRYARDEPPAEETQLEEAQLDETQLEEAQPADVQLGAEPSL